MPELRLNNTVKGSLFENGVDIDGSKAANIPGLHHKLVLKRMEQQELLLCGDLGQIICGRLKIGSALGASNHNKASCFGRCIYVGGVDIVKQDSIPRLLIL